MKALSADSPTLSSPSMASALALPAPPAASAQQSQAPSRESVESPEAGLQQSSGAAATAAILNPYGSAVVLQPVAPPATQSDHAVHSDASWAPAGGGAIAAFLAIAYLLRRILR